MSNANTIELKNTVHIKNKKDETSFYVIPVSTSAVIKSIIVHIESPCKNIIDSILTEKTKKCKKEPNFQIF